MKIYLKNYVKKRGLPVASFLEELFHKHYGFPTTYSDKECTKIQCSRGKNRSIDDVMCLIKTYYPSKTYKHIFEQFRIYLEKVNIDEDGEYSNALILCNDIEKWVFGYSWANTDKLFCGDYRHSSQSTDEGLGKYTYDIFMKKLGYTDKEINL